LSTGEKHGGFNISYAYVWIMHVNIFLCHDTSHKVKHVTQF